MRHFILIFLSIQIIVSCSNKKDLKEVQKLNEANQTDFGIVPDTVYLNRTYEAEFKFSSELDTIKLGEKDLRSIFFFVTTQKGTFKNVEEIKKVKYEVFRINENGIIEYRFKFQKGDSDSLKAILEDMVLLDGYYEDGNARMITRTYEVVFDCTVIENK